MVSPIDEPLLFEIVGHRGYGGTTPENTLAALRRSIKEAVKVAEVDIRLTSDGIPVPCMMQASTGRQGIPI